MFCHVHFVLSVLAIPLFLFLPTVLSCLLFITLLPSFSFPPAEFPVRASDPRPRHALINNSEEPRTNTTPEESDGRS
ncbi:hypothetical protein BDV11DRAFT_66816 [Aspergillus similis]